MILFYRQSERTGFESRSGQWFDWVSPNEAYYAGLTMAQFDILDKAWDQINASWAIKQSYKVGQSVERRTLEAEAPGSRLAKVTGWRGQTQCNQSFTSWRRYNLVVDEDVKKTTNQTNQASGRCAVSTTLSFELWPNISFKWITIVWQTKPLTKTQSIAFWLPADRSGVITRITPDLRDITGC